MANTELKIKMLKDNKGTHFLPFSTSKAVFIDGTDKTVDSKLTEIEAAIPTKTSDLTNDSNFVADANYVHTDNNYTTAEKTKLGDIETGAEVNIIETVKVNGTALTPDQDRAVDITVAGSAANITYDNTTSGLTADDVQEAIDELTDEKVDKVSGKGLSTNDYTTDEKNKLAGIEVSADVNTIESISVNNSAVTPDANKNVDITVPTKVSDLNNDEGFIDNTVSDLTNYYNKTEIDSKVASVYKYKGNVNTYADLPSSGQNVGDVYNITTADSTHGIKAGDNVAWDGTTWDVLAGTVDLSGYQTLIDSTHKLSADLVDDTSTTNKFVTTSEKTAWNAKQDALVSGTNIKTINNESLLGSGDISISEPIKILPLYYSEDEEYPEYNFYTNNVIDYNDEGYGIANGAYVVDTSICTQPYPEGICIYFGYRGKGNTYQEQDFELKHGDIVIVNHASDTVYSVGDRITVISNGLVYTSVVTEVSTATKPRTKLTTTHSLDQMAHHITAGGRNIDLFADEININDIDLTKEFDFGTGTIGSATFPAGTLFFLRYDSTIATTHLKNPGIIITPDGDMYKVTQLDTLVMHGTQIKPYVDLTSNQTIGGVKTFSSVPICATQPTSNDELANKAYVDAQVGGGGTWGTIGGTLSDQTDLQNALNAKQDTLVSGTNIKTINNESLLGSGDIDISVIDEIE